MPLTSLDILYVIIIFLYKSTNVPNSRNGNHTKRQTGLTIYPIISYTMILNATSQTMASYMNCLTEIRLDELRNPMTK